MTATKPDRSNYASWQDEKFKEDSIEWETNPLYGWCSKNLKPDGTNYNIYNDGLKIYTTIDSRMQRDAEQSVVEHLSTDLQPTFFSKLKELKHPPFSDDLSVSQIDDILDREIRKSERYRVLHERGLNFKEIKKNFNKPVEMNVFSWKGEVDTTMTPLDSIKYYLSYLRSSMMTMDVKTGAVRAYVGGPNYKYFMYDMVTGGKRQVGSTVKPFLYTLAMQNGYSPCTLVPNTEQTFYLPDGTTWTAKNSSSEREGQMVTLKWGLANSVNQISAWIMKKFNPQAMKNVMRKMGIVSPIDAVPSMFLGTSDISLYEMVGAFGTFGNHGVYTKPYFVDRIEDKDGNVLARFTPQQHEAIDQKTAYLMLNLMEGVVNEGTSQRLRWHPVYGHLTADIAGKTGTTQNQSDGWFIGITPELVTGVWTGADLRSIHFKGIHFGQGANMALPIYGRFMNKLYSDSTLNLSQDTKFDRPPNFNINLNCDEVNKKNSQKNQTTTQDDFF
jgi:penicillin-binding protein 1A